MKCYFFSVFSSQKTAHAVLLSSSRALFSPLSAGGCNISQSISLVYPYLSLHSAEIVVSRRAEGQRTHQLLEGATACLDSPSTGAWVQVLGEVRTEAGQTEGSHVVLMTSDGL